MSHLFVDGQFTSHSGLPLFWKIECEALTPADWDTVARVVARRMRFGRVWGIPRGGTLFADALRPYCTYGEEDELVADDVWTSGRSMNEFKRSWSPHRGELHGVVLFRRGPATIPAWVHPVFGLNPYFGD